MLCMRVHVQGQTERGVIQQGRTPGEALRRWHVCAGPGTQQAQHGPLLMDYSSLYGREGGPPPEVPSQRSLKQDPPAAFGPQHPLAHPPGNLVPPAMLQQGALGVPGVVGIREGALGEGPLQLPRDMPQQAPSGALQAAPGVVLPQAPREMLQQAERLQQASMEMLQKASREILMQAVTGQPSSNAPHQAPPPRSAPIALHSYLENRVRAP